MRRALLALISMSLWGQSHWPAQLAADVKTQSWDAAARVGEAVIAEVEAGRMYARFTDVAQEIQARSLYAQALERVGRAGQAREQRAIARALSADPDSALVAAETSRRFANLKTQVLGTEIIVPAPFAVPGDGRIAVVVLWATWCAPCKSELAEVREYRNPAARIVTLDVDRLDPAAKRDYLKIESLEGPQLPQLYVIDSSRNIRFHVTGFDDARHFARKLDWMIEAAAR